MTEKDMKKLSRGDLLELLLTQGKENDDLRARLEEAERKLQDRRIRIEEAGSLAEAMVSVNGIIEAAQKTADEYQEAIRLRMDESHTRAEALLQAAEEKAAALTREAEEQVALLTRATEEKCAAMEAEAKTRSENYWKEVSEKMEAFYQAHQGLRELLSVVSKPQ